MSYNFCLVPCPRVGMAKILLLTAVATASFWSRCSFGGRSDSVGGNVATAFSLAPAIRSVASAKSSSCYQYGYESRKRLADSRYVQPCVLYEEVLSTTDSPPEHLLDTSPPPSSRSGCMEVQIPVIKGKFVNARQVKHCYLQFVFKENCRTTAYSRVSSGWRFQCDSITKCIVLLL